MRAAADSLKDAARSRIHVFISTSPVHRENKLRMTRQQVLEAAVGSVRLARELCEDVEFSCEDATRTEPDFLREIYAAVLAAGATTLNIPDTVGYATVAEYGALIKDIAQSVTRGTNAILSVHTHNDLGLATATTLEGVLAGARQVECTLGGLGERAGNAPLEEILMGLRTRRDIYGVGDHLRTQGIYRASRIMAAVTGLETPPGKPIIGQNAFTHGSGIHQHGMLCDRSTYEVMDPEALGIPQGGLTLGKLSGRHALQERAEQLGITLTEHELNQAFAKFKDLADRKKDLSDRDIVALLREQTNLSGGLYKMHSFQIFSGNRMTATATVSLQREQEIITRADCGDGPVEACFHAVNQIVAHDCQLESYQLRAVTEGEDALGEVTVRVRFGQVAMLGKGLSTDIIEASCLAYLNAVNRLLTDESEKAAAAQAQ